MISVIVPVYNAASYLHSCVTSILAQRVEDMELLLVNDGSTDGSDVLAEELAHKDQRVRVIHTPNGGAAHARNVGLDHAKGEFIVFIDADDLISENHLQALMLAQKAHDADMTVCSVIYKPGPAMRHPSCVCSCWEFIEKVLYRDGVADYPVGKLYRKEMFDGIRFTEGITSEDFEIFYRLYQRAQRVAITDETAYYYIQHADSVSNSGFSEKFFNRIEICERILHDVTEDRPDLLPAAQSRVVDEAIWLYGILPRGYYEQANWAVKTVKQYGKTVLRNKKATVRLKRKIRIFNLLPMLWKVRMKLKTLLIVFYHNKPAVKAENIQILIYCDHWQNGGVEAYLINQLRRWELSKMSCVLLTAEKTTDIYDLELKKLGIRHDVLLQGENESPIIRILQTFGRFRRYLKSNSCEILYLNLTNSVTMRYAMLAKRAGVKRRIAHSHASGIQPGFTHGLKMIAHYLGKWRYARYLTDLWACSNQAAEFLYPSTMQDRATFVPNAVDISNFLFNEQQRMRIRMEQNIPEENCVIGTVARCTAEKNQSFLLKIFHKVHIKNSKTTLLIVGDGPLRNRLEEQVKELGLQDAVIFYGFTDDPAPLYCAMDLFCLPSIAEGFGIAALEAQISGCYCLLSNIMTQQVKVTENVSFLPLDEPDVWVNCITDHCSRNAVLQRNNISIDQSFDISNSAKHVQSLLLNHREDCL